MNTKDQRAHFVSNIFATGFMVCLLSSGTSEKLSIIPEVDNSLFTKNYVNGVNTRDVKFNYNVDDVVNGLDILFINKSQEILRFTYPL